MVAQVMDLSASTLGKAVSTLGDRVSLRAELPEAARDRALDHLPVVIWLLQEVRQPPCSDAEALAFLASIGVPEEDRPAQADLDRWRAEGPAAIEQSRDLDGRWPA